MEQTKKETETNTNDVLAYVLAANHPFVSDNTDDCAVCNQLEQYHIKAP